MAKVTDLSPELVDLKASVERLIADKVAREEKQASESPAK
jgi:outer membrane murein-binding lipoprotein Lpp